MERKEYSAGAVKLSFWFVEFRKVVGGLLSEGKSTDQIKDLAMNENLFAAPTALRSIKFIIPLQAALNLWTGLHPSFHAQRQLATQKLFALIAAMAYDTLFFDFVYEVIREKMILGTYELADSDVRVFQR